ncbi:hypothetical protein DNU06_07945 [Putridiphycobacter roseus]|uniref:Uncharacterized protein n=1 Tax=Putridiphycobacter roseus TaxID=2219161 RepID=A0A2W1NGT2_9FLAO|nr:hypothetical protein [Putridiphycobacter roseus]PZE17196.1 hypothetical protein DNU06_07945 [Putridiphycobacter roseus]
MEDLIALGRKRTILLSISILLVSVHTIYLYHATHPVVETKKIVQQAIRFLLTILLLVMIYKGKKGAKIIGIVLFSLGLLGALIGLFMIDKPFLAKTPLLVMSMVYALAIYFFSANSSFKAFFESQQHKKDNLDI